MKGCMQINHVYGLEAFASSRARRNDRWISRTALNPLSYRGSVCKDRICVDNDITHVPNFINSLEFMSFQITLELQWLAHLWDHENMFETGVVRANEC